jgi:hypothetical protein
LWDQGEEESEYECSEGSDEEHQQFFDSIFEHNLHNTYQGREARLERGKEQFSDSDDELQMSKQNSGITEGEFDELFDQYHLQLEKQSYSHINSNKTDADLRFDVMDDDEFTNRMSFQDESDRRNRKNVYRK